MSQIIAAEAEQVVVAEIVDKIGPLQAVSGPAAERAIAVVDDIQGQATLLQLIERAINNPVLDLARVERLLEIKTQWEKRQAEKAYYDAVAAFKSDPPTVVKNKHVVIPHQDGNGTTEYWHATLDECVNKLVPALSKHGLSHRWDIDYLDKGLIKVTCTMRHRLGHYETVAMQAGRDTSGQKNSLQEQQSTVSYLERYTFLAITGMAAAGMDDDGMSAEDREQSDKTLRITPDEKEILAGLQTETEADGKRLLAHFKIGALEDLPRYRFEEARKLLEQKRDWKAGETSKPSVPTAKGKKQNGRAD